MRCTDSCQQMLYMLIQFVVKLEYEWLYWKLNSQQLSNEEPISGLLSTSCSAMCNNPAKNISCINDDTSYHHQHEDIVCNAKWGGS